MWPASLTPPAPHLPRNRRRHRGVLQPGVDAPRGRRRPLWGDLSLVRCGRPALRPPHGSAPMPPPCGYHQRGILYVPAGISGRGSSTRFWRRRTTGRWCRCTSCPTSPCSCPPPPTTPSSTGHSTRTCAPRTAAALRRRGGGRGCGGVCVLTRRLPGPRSCRRAPRGSCASAAATQARPPSSASMGARPAPLPS